MKINRSVLCSVIMSALASSLSVAASINLGADTEKQIELAQEFLRKGQYADSERIYREIEASENHWHSWVGTSGRYSAYIKSEDYESAYSLTEEIVARRPDLAGLMVIWNAQTATSSGDTEKALQLTKKAFSDYQNVVVDHEPVGLTALQMQVQLLASEGRYSEASISQRLILETYPSLVNPEETLAYALLLEAIEQIGIASLDSELCETSSPCVIRNKQILAGDLGRDEPYSDIGSYRFVFSDQDRDFLEKARNSKPFEASQTAVACTLNAASTGFQAPFSHTSIGLEYLADNPDSGFHPGIDLNGTGDDCLLDFAAVADGCVTFVAANTNGTISDTASNWTTAIIKHSYIKEWRSQYAHGDKVYVAKDAAVTKGSAVGNIGKVSAGSCHLHFEIREGEGTVDSGSFWKVSTKTEVADYYQNPLPFLSTHPKYYASPIWWDEDQMTQNGSWTAVTTSGNEDDHRYAATTATSTTTNRALKVFQATRTGSHSVYMFIPYTTRSLSDKVPVKITNALTGATVKSFTVDQSSASKDSWIRLGVVSLTKSTRYKLEIGTNTNQTGAAAKSVVIDDFMIVSTN